MTVHAVSRELPYRADQMFELVLDVESYPRFVPWWESARVRERRPNCYHTDQVIRLNILRQRFSSVTTFEAPHWIEIRSSGGALRRFDLVWKFAPRGDTGCLVELTAWLEVGSRALQSLAHSLSQEAIRVQLRAFQKEAERLYGRPAAAAALEPTPAVA